MLACRIRMVDSNDDIHLATDDNFIESNGKFYYVGRKKRIKIPRIIKGVNVTSYDSMFNTIEGRLVTKVVSDNLNVTSMDSTFLNHRSDNLDLSEFNTSNVNTMISMFSGCRGNLDLSNVNTSNVRFMQNMFLGSVLVTLDLSSFDVSKAATDNMFMNCTASVGYARTQADANKFNSSSNKPAGLTFVVK